MSTGKQEMLDIHILPRMCIAVLAVLLCAAVPHCLGSDSGSAFGDATCGIKPVKRPDLRIFNGRDAALGGWPWSGRMKGKRGVYTVRCSMSLIGREWALTAGHCVTGGIQSLYGVFGEIDNAEIEPSEQRVEIDRIIVHPQFGPHPIVGTVDINDIALLHFKTPVNLTDYVHPICINEDTKESETYDNCWIVGWGLDIVELPRYLQESPWVVLNQHECVESIRPYILDTELCGTGKEPRENTHTCQGDSGGGMTCMGTDQRWYLVGVSSWGSGYGCSDNTEEVHTRVSNYTDFIESVITRIDDCSLPDTLCSDGKTCLLIEELCDDKPNCPDGADERNCSRREILLCTNTTCQNGGECRNNSEGILCVCTAGWTGDYCEVEIPSCANTNCQNEGECRNNSEGISCVCTNGWMGDYCEVVDCGPSEIEIPVGGAIHLTSPGYPSNYPDNAQCIYFIYVPDGFKILIELVEFHLEYGSDFLLGINREDGSPTDNRYRFTGKNVPRNLTSDTSSFILHLITNGAVNEMGFSVMISPINVTGLNECDWSPCENGGNCSDEYDGYQCECTEAYTGHICHEVNLCGDANIVIPPQTTVALSSYMYPSFQTILTQYNCRWTVTTASGRQILVKVLDYLLYYWSSTVILGGEQNLDSVNDLGNYTYISNGNTLDIQFVTMYWSASERFLLELSEKPDGDDCASQPCLNGGRCYDNVNGFNCKCRRGYTGKRCQIGIPLCGRNSFACNNMRCIDPYFVCDGRNHCGDGSDEKNCACEFRCHNDRCIPERYVCDSKNNCRDWSDELRPECNL